MSAFQLFSALPGQREDSDSDQESNAKWQTPKLYSPSRFMQSRQLGVLDPSLYMNEETEDLYEQSPNHVGRLWFTLTYRKATEQLTVVVLKARNLRLKREGNSGQSGDCYVKVFLEQDERRMYTTSVKKKTNNPTFNETFCIQVPLDEMLAQNLIFQVYQMDRHRHQKVIGYISYPMKCADCSGKETRMCRDLDLNSNTDISDCPEIKVALTYHPSMERLTVSIFECKNLPQKDNGNPVDIYVKVGFHYGLQGKELKSKKTDMLSSGKSCNESFSFNKVSDLDQTSVRLTVMQQNSTIGLFDKPLGFLVFGSELFAKRRCLDHWKEMLQRVEEQVSYWQPIQLFH